jgi:hypothetical protein
MSEIQAGEGWRLLGPDEVVRALADECYGLSDGEWHPVSPMNNLREALDFHAVRRRIPAKPEAMDIWNAFDMSVGSGVAANFVIQQMGASQDEWDVVVGNATEARQLADWLTRYADWREAQEFVAKTPPN